MASLFRSSLIKWSHSLHPMRPNMWARMFSSPRTLSDGVSATELSVHELPDNDYKYAVLSFNRAPVNSMNDVLVTETITHLTSLKDVPEVRGLVLTSSIPGFFSAGIDLKMFTKGSEFWVKYWTSLRRVYELLLNNELVTVALIQGHAPGAGAVVSLACDHRIAVDGKYKMGLNEVAVGLPVPKFCVQRFQDICGFRNSEKYLPYGKQFGPQEAKSIDFVDAVVPSVEDAMQEAHKIFSLAFKLSPKAMNTTMDYCRESTLKKFYGGANLDIETAREYVSSQAFQDHLNHLAEKLKKK